jgi:tetratricopeptide (TPR) repeat protein
VKAAKSEKSVGNYLHAQDYMVYAHLQLGQDQQVRVVLDDMMLENDFKATLSGAHYALAAAPARYAVKEPNRFNGFLGAARAAEKLGDRATAKANYEELIAMAAGSDRPTLAAAKNFVASNSQAMRARAMTRCG